MMYLSLFLFCYILEFQKKIVTLNPFGHGVNCVFPSAFNLNFIKQTLGNQAQLGLHLNQMQGLSKEVVSEKRLQSILII